MHQLQQLKSISQSSRRKNHDEIVLLAKTNLNTTKVLIAKALIDSYISHDEFVSLNNVLREYNKMK